MTSRTRRVSCSRCIVLMTVCCPSGPMCPICASDWSVRKAVWARVQFSMRCCMNLACSSRFCFSSAALRSASCLSCWAAWGSGVWGGASAAVFSAVSSWLSSGSSALGSVSAVTVRATTGDFKIFFSGICGGGGRSLKVLRPCSSIHCHWAMAVEAVNPARRAIRAK